MDLVRSTTLPISQQVLRSSPTALQTPDLGRGMHLFDASITALVEQTSSKEAQTLSAEKGARPHTELDSGREEVSPRASGSVHCTTCDCHLPA